MNPKIFKILKSLEKFPDQYWSITRETAQFLNLLIKDQRYNKVLEIGTSSGYSGIWFAEAMKHTDGHFYTIESHDERFLIAQSNFKKSGLQKHITQIKGHAPEIIPKNPRYFDFIFLDATKHEYLDYFKILKNRLKKGGMIVADNINTHKKELENYRKALKNLEPKYPSFKLNIGSGLLISVNNP